MASTDPLATMREQLAAAQADNRALREALGECNKRLELACGCDGEPTARIENLMYHAERAGSKPWRDTRAVLAARAALSRAPGSDDALREMLAWAVSEGARAGEEGARTGRSETNESIVSRILGPEGGKA